MHVVFIIDVDVDESERWLLISIDDDDAAAAADRELSSELSNEGCLLLLGDREFVLFVLSVLPFIYGNVKRARGDRDDDDDDDDNDDGR